MCVILAKTSQALVRDNKRPQVPAACPQDPGSVAPKPSPGTASPRRSPHRKYCTQKQYFYVPERRGWKIHVKIRLA